MRAARTSAVATIVLWIGLTAGFGQQAAVREETLTFRTYPFSDPDPAPLIGPLYPYFRFQGYSLAGRDQGWKMVTLENPFVKVLVAPEIGGKVWGALEKSTGRPFVYWNGVVKFREIALRGPWTSGGIEFNFGIIGHAPTTATPVDYLLRENEDGSVSCVVGAMDLPSRTQWRVNIRLPKDAAYLETECLWYNPTTLHDSLYHWMTAAEDVGDDLKYYYPGNRYVGHGGEASPWPAGPDGRNLSYYRDNNFGGSKSYHLLGEYGESFGGYYENSGFGYGHWAFYDDKPGMKLWIWSLARDGEIWKDLLTDKRNGQYTEPQTGLLYNQAAADSGLTPFKHAFFAPHSVMRWKEIWFPVKDIGGMVAASPYAALNVTRDGKRLRLGLCPLRYIADDLVVSLAEAQVYTEHLSLKPMETFLREIDLGVETGEVAVSLGKEKLRWTSGDKTRNALSRPVTAPADFDWTSAEGLFVAGEELARQRNYAGALTKFLACLEKEPGHVRALARVAELFFRRADYDAAFDYARRALAIDAYDAGANFIYGVASRSLGRLADAKDGFGWAARSLAFRSAAYTELAEISLVEKNPERAAEYAGRAVDYNRYDLGARQLQAISSRLRGDEEGAVRALREILEIDPLNHLARFENYLLERDAKTRDAFAALVRGEFPQETYLELALTYVRLGLEEEARLLLDLAPMHPVACYWRAYLERQRDEAKSGDYLRRAAELSPDLVFPHRLETLPVLRWAASKTDDWKTTYYLGLLLWNIGEETEAKSLLGGLGGRPAWSPFYLLRARLFGAKEDRPRVLADIKRAVELDRRNWRAWRAETDFYEKAGEFEAALGSAAAVYGLLPEKPALVMDYARALLHSGKYGECLKVLDKTTVLPYEGAWEGHDLFRQANLFLAVQALAGGRAKRAAALAEKARRWPEHLGVGRPFDVDERLENILLAAAYELTGDKGKATGFYESVAEAAGKFRAGRGAVDFISAAALKKLGRESEAVRLLEEWRNSRGEDNPVYAWSSAKYRGDEAKAQDVLERLKATPSGASWDLGTGDRYFRLVLDIGDKALKK